MTVKIAERIILFNLNDSITDKDKITWCEEKSYNAPLLTFADVAKNNFLIDIGVTENFLDITIKPKLTQNSKLTKQYINQNLIPTKLKIEIKNLRTMKSGEIIIKSQIKNETRILQKDIEIIWVKNTVFT